ncbi:hypothetical protein H4Q26_001426 [Puccinia striiformis f. sp. tritici PST-130]|nr:hypothetical protein H4Q26_001426 [Puccinia striiformis f. sp. tritici PST-130]
MAGACITLRGRSPGAPTSRLIALRLTSQILSMWHNRHSTSSSSSQDWSVNVLDTLAEERNTQSWEAGPEGRQEITEPVYDHEVIAEVDRGAPILTRTVELKKNESLEALNQRMHELEHELIVAGTSEMLRRIRSVELKIKINYYKGCLPIQLVQDVSECLCELSLRIPK